MKYETKTMHLFAGHGGGLLADLILGHRPIAAVEWDSYACQVLRERTAEGWFPGLRVHEGDVSLFDPSEYTGIVDCIHAGFPCQDISIAGKQAGVSEGTRSGLYREVLRIAGVVRPKQLFLENVSAILSNGLGTVLGDLAALGYDCRWLCIRASDVGAPHHRDRWFGLATYTNSDSKSDVPINAETSRMPESDVPYSNDDRCGNGSIQYVNRRDAAPKSGVDGKEGTLADTKSSGLERWTFGGNKRSSITGLRKSSWAESSIWQSEPELGRVANGVPNRIHRLKGLGNAQVPLQAAAAYRLLGGL